MGGSTHVVNNPVYTRRPENKSRPDDDLSDLPPGLGLEPQSSLGVENSPGGGKLTCNDTEECCKGAGVDSGEHNPTYLDTEDTQHFANVRASGEVGGTPYHHAVSILNDADVDESG